VRIVSVVVNLVLALGLAVVAGGALASGLGVAMARAWEVRGLDSGVEPGAWFWLDDEPIYYESYGSTEVPTLVLIHGRYPEGMATWQANAAPVAQAGVRVIAIDLLGFGHSAREPEANYTVEAQAARVAGTLEHLDVRHATLAGHGWGAAVALELARRQSPTLVRSVILLSPALRGEDRAGWETVASVPYLGEAATWAFGAGGPFWSRQVRRSFCDPDTRGMAYAEQVQPLTRVHGTIQALQAIVALPRERVGELDLVTLQAPIRVIHGADDPLVSEAAARRRVESLPNAELVQVVAAGHYVHVEEPAQVNALLIERTLQRH
jgi:pimeloyl-ACP methyl ester carboxylesterase